MTAKEAKDTRTMFSLEEVANRWSTSVKTIRRYVWRGEIKAKRLGPRCIRVPLIEIQRFEASMRDA
jgi:excisionase family DNA binding protein